MSLPNYLAKIKSSGIYRFVWDKSQVTAAEAETLRLVVGYSEKGPFNTPVYIDNTADFKTIFGGINKKLEKRGVFFHRMALQALSAGPILALNLKKFTDEKVTYAASNTNGAFATSSVEVDKIYDTSRFWSLDPEQLTTLDNPTSATATNKPYIVIAAADSDASSNTIFVKPYAPSGYDVTIKSWYSTMSEDMPDYFEDYSSMKVSDFFAEIYVFKGQFTPAVAQSDELKKYFDVVGDSVVLKSNMVNALGDSVDVLEALAENENSNFVQRYQGILLPNFKNASGAYISLDLLFNSDYNKHKMIMKLNSDLLDDETITVESIASRGWDNTTAADVTNSIKTTLNLEVDSSWVGVTVLNDKGIKPLTNIYDAATLDSDGASSTEYVDAEGYIVTTGSGIVAGYDVYSITDEPNYILYCLGENDKSASVTGNKITITGADAVAYAQKFVAGNRYLVATTPHETSTKTKAAKVQDLTVATLVKVEYTAGEAAVEDSKLVLTFDKDSYLINVYESEKSTGDDSSTSETIYHYGILECVNILSGGTLTSPLYLKGYTYDKDNAKPKSNSVEDKLAWQKFILDTLNVDSATGYPGLIDALTNRTDVDYRYIVDTFESFVDEELKACLSLLAKKKDNCLLLTNFPAIKTFIKSKNASFVDDNGAFKMKYVKSGSNPTKTSSVKFSLPSADNGASWCSFNTPLVFSDGTVKTTVPAAALVSNNFMVKYSSRQPYYIVAGPTYGKLSYTNMVGPDYNFTRDDLDILEPMGVNATVYVPRKGVFINSNQTAKQNPVTTLSKINVRELVIYLQDQIEDMLQNYQWEFNTSTLRDTVKAKADSILENVKANGGIYAYVNVCDETNNTDDVISNEMLVLSTSIEPGMGAGKLIQELTLYSKGKLSTSTTVSE